MNATDLYNKSLKAHKGKEKTASQKIGLSIGILHSLYRGGKTATGKELITGRQPDYVVIRENILEAVANGTIWDVRNIGAKSVRVICEWLEATEGGKQ